MKKQNLAKVSVVIFAILLIIGQASFSQSKSIRIGRISPSDFIQGEYEKDPEASAVILYDFGETYFSYNSVNDGFEYVFKKVMRMQILTDDGLNWADYSIRLSESGSSRERMGGFDAYVHNLEGNKVVSTRVRSRDLLTEQTTDRLKTMKLSFPQAKAGSILEITYTITSPFFYSPPDWQFQYSIPVVYSEYILYQPEFYNFNFFVQGYISMKDHSTTPENASANIPLGGGRSQVYRYTNYKKRWLMEDVPAMRSEPFTSNIMNFVAYLHVELRSITFAGGQPRNFTLSWADVDKRLREAEGFGDYLSGSRRFRSLMAGLAADGAEEDEKISSVVNWFRQNIKWNGRRGIGARSSPNDVIKNGSGNVAEINLLLVAALRELGLNANPVISSTRDNGIVLEAFPTIDRFNYVLAAVKRADGSTLLLDATEPLTPFGMLPQRAINYKGRLLERNSASWIDLKVDASAQDRIELNATITEDGKMNGNLAIKAGGYSGFSKRRAIANQTTIEDYHNTLKTKYSNLELSEITIENKDELSETLTIFSDFELLDANIITGDLIIFQPLLIEATKENPFKLEDRKYPVDFVTPIQESLAFAYEIPEGFEVDFIPANANIRLGRDASYVFGTRVEGNRIEFSSFLNIRKTMFMPDEYQAIKEFFDKVVEKQAEQVVLKKSS